MKTRLVFPTSDIIYATLTNTSLKKENGPLLSKENDLYNRIAQTFANRTLSMNETRQELCRVIAHRQRISLYSLPSNRSR